jgi:hypothetical protein
MNKDEKTERTTELVEEAYKAKRFEGLGDALVCKLCEAIFVGLNDAKRHLTLYHRILTRRRLEEVLYEFAKRRRGTKALGEKKELTSLS